MPALPERLPLRFSLNISEALRCATSPEGVLLSGMSVTRRFAICVTCVALLVSGGRAQQTATSQVSGVVKDPSSAAVPGATVHITQTETQFTRTVTSAPDGSYTLPNLPVGPYRLEVSAKGFSTYVQSGIVLQVNSNPVISPVLQVGSTSETIQVNSEV